MLQVNMQSGGCLGLTLATVRKEVIGNATLYLGDFFELIAQGVIPEKSVDSVVSSPPFIAEDLGLVTDEEYYEWYAGLLAKLEPLVADYALLFNSNTRLYDITQRFCPYGRPLIWDKFRGQAPYRYEPIFIHRMSKARFDITNSIFTDCYHYESVDKAKMVHPYENPLEIYERWLINILAFREGEKFTRTILDPFMGSGKTLLACNNLGLKSIGFEINPDYFEIAVETIRNGEGSCTAHLGTRQRIKSALQQQKLTEAIPV